MHVNSAIYFEKNHQYLVYLKKTKEKQSFTLSSELEFIASIHVIYGIYVVYFIILSMEFIFERCFNVSQIESNKLNSQHQL